MNKIICGIMMSFFILQSAMAYEKPITIYDKDWQKDGYVRQGTIYDKDWQKKGYIRKGIIYDKDWQKKGYFKEDRKCGK